MDIWDFAITTEIDAENFYKEQAVSNRQLSLRPLFIMLAEDERNHARILRTKSKGLPFDINDYTLPPIASMFSGMANILDDIKKVPNQVDLYQVALEKEKQSIDLYQKLLKEATDNKEVFEYLIKQEEDHYKIVEEIIKMVNRPNKWVESSEFGIREEY